MLTTQRRSGSSFVDSGAPEEGGATVTSGALFLVGIGGGPLIPLVAGRLGIDGGVGSRVVLTGGDGRLTGGAREVGLGTTGADSETDRGEWKSG